MSSGFSFGTIKWTTFALSLRAAPTTLVAVGYMQNGTVSLAQNFTQDHVAAAKSLRLPQGFVGAESSSLFLLI